MAEDTSGRNWQPPPHMEAVALLGRQIKFVIVFTISAMLTALALTYVYSEKYEAGTNIFYRQNEIPLLRETDQQAFGSPAPSTPFKVVSKTVDDLVHSWAVLKPVVESLNLANEDRVYEGPWWERWYNQAKDYLYDTALTIWAVLKFGRSIDPDPVSKTIQKLSENVEVTNEDSYVFTISVRDKHPRRAAAIADAISAELVERLREQSIDAGTAKRRQVEDLMQAKDKVLRGHRASIDAFMRENELVSISDEISRGTERSSELEKTLVSLRGELADKRSRLGATEETLSRKSGGYLSPDDKQRLESERIELQIAIDGIVARIASQDRNLAALLGRLRELPALDLKLQQMQTELEGAKRDWVRLRDALQEAIVRENQVSSEVKILNPAGVPTAPVAPIKVYQVALAGSLGLLASAALVFILNFFNVRLLFSTLGIAGRRAPAPGDTPPAPADAPQAGTQRSTSS